MKKKLVVLFIAILAFSWYYSLSTMIKGPSQIQEHIDKAEDFEERGIYVDAIAEYEEILLLKPDDVDVLVRMAQDYLKIEEDEEYVSTLKKAIEAEKNGSEKALDELMNYYIDNQEKSKAVSYIRDYTKDSPDIDYANEWLLRLKGSYHELYCVYDEMYGMYNDSMVAKVYDVYTVLNSSGDQFVDKGYSEITPYSMDGYARTVNEKGNTIFIDQDGLTRVAADPKYKDQGMLSGSRISASYKGKYGYLDEKGQPVTDFKWNKLTGFNKVGMAEKKGKWAIVNEDGKEKTEYLYDDVIVDDYGIACIQDRIFVKQGKKYLMINPKGKEFSKAIFDDAKAFNPEGYAAVCQKGKWGFVNPEGEMVIKCQYENALSFSNGYAAVYKDGKWGYIDEDNNMIIAPVFLEATSFSSKGSVAVKIKAEEENEPDLWHLIQLDIES